MSEMTPLDKAHALMERDATARLQFYDRLAEAELFVLLTGEAEGDQISPQVFEVEDGRFVLGFDRVERLAEFAGGGSPYAALSGRVLAQMLAGQEIGLGLNLDVAPSSILIPADAISWLADTTGTAPDQIETRANEFSAPHGLPEILLTALDAKLAAATGLAHAAYLVGVEYENAARGHMLGFVDALDGAEKALAQAVSEALTFSGIEAGALDVGFFAASDPVAGTLAKVGLRFDLPRVPKTSLYERPAPGSDPDKPPILVDRTKP